MLSDIPSETPPPDLAALAEDHYFNANPPPKDLDKHIKLAKEFIDFHAAAGRRLVLVTSGGTTVPLGVFPFQEFYVFSRSDHMQRSKRCALSTTFLQVPVEL